MKIRHFFVAMCVATAVSIVATSADASTLLNGATDTREAAFPSFLDNTLDNTQAWAFPKTSNRTLLTGGVLSSVDVVAVGATGGSGITISNTENGGVPRTADLNGYSWNYGYGGGDQAARNELANDGGGIWSAGGTLTINIPTSIVPEGALAQVELLGVAGLANTRTMDVSANGVPFVTDWDLIADGGNHWNSVLEFTVPADASGVSVDVSPGSFGDINPYIHAIGVSFVVPTPVPEPSSIAVWTLLGLAGFGYFRIRRKK